LPGCETSTGAADRDNSDPGESGVQVFGAKMTLPEKT